MSRPSALRRVGTEIINGSAVPVYQLPNGSRYVEVIDFLSGDKNLVSVEAAKQFKTGHYPIEPEIADALGPSRAIAFSKLSEAEQDAATAVLLTRVFERMRASDAHFSFMDN